MIFINGTSTSQQIRWEKVINDDLQFNAAFKVLPTKGNIAWEYNPFRNLRLNTDMYEYDGKLHSEKEFKQHFSDWNKETSEGKYPPGVFVYQKGELVDFITDQLSFDINHPVSIAPSYSYDGSVDLILNDGKNPPRLINSRFSTTGMNTYEVINRKGDNDTNIYDMGDQFDIDSSLYKKTNKIPKIVFNGTQAGGDLKIGNYHFYFKYADADGNETDFVAESGLVSIFKGLTSPLSINTGQRDENSLKCVSFTIKNIDSGYQHLHVYYTRSSAEINQNFVTEAVKINQNFLVNTNGICNVLITGDEESEKIPISDINLSYNVIQSAKSQAICQNMLFMANVQKAEIPYEELQDLSLRFLPYLCTTKYPLSMDECYNISSNSKGYFDSKFIYNFTGYWNKDLYRLGIVYVMKDGTLSPAFNIRGRENVKKFEEYTHTEGDKVNSEAYTEIPTTIINDEGKEVRVRINYDESTYLLIKGGKGVKKGGNGFYENIKGVVSLDSTLDTNTILGFDIRTDENTIKELRKYVKGFFFVRQRRMPMTLCQGITIGVERNSHLPAIPTTHGVTAIDYNNTYAETRDVNPDEVHYVMEGFMGRYTYKLKPKSSGFWKKIGMALAVTVVAAAGIIGSVFTGGAAGGIAAGGIAAMIGAGTVAVSSVLIPVAIGAAVVVGSTTLVALGQATVLSIQQARNSSAAARPYKGRKAPIPNGYKREEVEDSRKLDADFKQRIILLDKQDCDIKALLVPDCVVHPSKYNQFFNGDEFVVEYATSQAITNFSNIGYFQNDNNRHFYISGYQDWDMKKKRNYVSLLSVPDSVAIVGMRDEFFKSKAGDTSSATRFEQTRITYKDSTLNDHSDLVRGNYGPYVAMTGFQGPAATTVNIKVPGYNEGNMLNYISMRMTDHSEYSAISDRFDIAECKNSPKALVQGQDEPYHFQTNCYRGDCYICQFTQRINRNFNDDSAPYNESIVDPKTWRNYNLEANESFAKINVGDVNAVELGMWVTFRVRSNYNLNIRTIDNSYVAEEAECGHPRGYYPYHPISTDGSYKIPEAQVYNLGFSKSLSERYNFEQPDVPYIKNWFGTRVMYSDISITDGYKNGYRTFKGTAYRDYTREHGSITKIVELGGNLIVVFEHGIGFLEINERAVAAQAQSGNVYITSNNVLPEKVTILSDAFGSQWADSVLKVPVNTGDTSSVIFGVDTVAKKIWMCDGRNVTCISDFKVQEFLNNNITLGERDLTPIIGVRNVKTVYNAYKQDVMFTFYDCLEGFEDKAWNLCYNLTLKKFITFYSWVPAFMANIDNIPFSFDRDIVKGLGKLGVSKIGNDFSDGIVLSNNIIPNSLSVYQIGKLGLSNRILPFTNNTDKDKISYKIKYEVVRDNYGNHNIFTTKEIGDDTYLVFNVKSGQIDTFNDKNDDGTINTSVFGGERNKIKTGSGQTIQIFGTPKANRYSPIDIHSELYYRNIAGHACSDWYEQSNMPEYQTNPGKVWKHRDILNQDENQYKQAMQELFNESIENNYPIFKDRSGRKIMLPEEDRINDGQVVRYINIRATILVKFNYDNTSLLEVYKTTFGDNSKEDSEGYINCGYYESTVAVTTEWNMQFLTSDFWKHGQASLINPNLADDIKPTVWYGKQHPFEFEVCVVNEPSVHKIFQNLEIISNKAQPESFHFEIIGEAYDFAKDKAAMYFRQEARKALFQYNGVDISYNKDFLKIQPRQSSRSAELVYSYYERQDKLQEIKDSYIGSAKNSKSYEKLDTFKYSDAYNSWVGLTPNKDYRHLSGAEIVYYKNRNEYRIWQHQPAINIDDLSQDTATSVIRGNCQYLEDRWRVSINPLLICYKNEYNRKVSGSLCQPANSTWKEAAGSKNTKLPPITIRNTSLPSIIKQKGAIDFPNTENMEGVDNALYGLYNLENGLPIDNTNWLNDLSVYKTDFGEAQNRRETDIRDKFVKVRIRYSGEDLAVIDFLNTIYTVSYA